MKYTDPSEFFKYIIEKADINIINDKQKCLALALDLLDSEKTYFRLLKQAFNNDVYKELIKAYNSESKTKTAHINKAKKILTDDCFIIEEKANEAVGWLASVIYSNEWNSFTNETNAKEDDKEIICEQPKPKHEKTTENKNNPNNKNIFGKNWTLEDINLEMIYCPAGSFMMGSPSEELGRDGNETIHQVTISKPFYIGKYEVTQKEYESVMWENPSNFKGENNPVECVSWNDAMEFCDKLNKKYAKIIPQGYKFDLPTEAQWEYACRAGTITSFNNGKNITLETYCCNLDEVGWYSKNKGNKTHPVGQKKPNAWGIYDMHGNVMEWCKDWYGDYPSSSITDPVGPTNGYNRVFRGGSCFQFAFFCRSACRNYMGPNERGNDIGFRVALVPID